MSRFATRITVSSAWAGMLQSRLAARAANASLIARSLGDWWDHHAAVNMQTVPSRASPFGLERLVQRLVAVAESRQQRAETRRDARRSFGLRPEFAQVADQAGRTAGLACQADVAPMQDQPMVRVLQVFRRGEFEQPLLDLERILARSDAGAVGDSPAPRRRAPRAASSIAPPRFSPWCGKARSGGCTSPGPPRRASPSCR